MATLGERQRSRRKDELGVYQRAVAAAAGMAGSHLSNVEYDRIRIAEQTLRRLATVLALDPDDLVAQARAEDRLSRRPTPVRVRERPSAVPPPPWITVQEAADILDVTLHTVNGMIRRGALQPAMKQPGIQYRAPWWVDEQAVRSYTWERKARRPAEIPAGYITVRAFAAAATMAVPSVQAALARGSIASEKVGQRRLIPEEEWPRWLERRRQDAAWRAPPKGEAAWAAALDDLPLDGIKADLLRLRYGPVRRTRREVATELGVSERSVAYQDGAALRILRAPAFRAFTCGLPHDHPLRLAVLHAPGLDTDLCGGARD